MGAFAEKIIKNIDRFLSYTQKNLANEKAQYSFAKVKSQLPCQTSGKGGPCPGFILTEQVKGAAVFQSECPCNAYQEAIENFFLEKRYLSFVAHFPYQYRLHLEKISAWTLCGCEKESYENSLNILLKNYILNNKKTNKNKLDLKYLNALQQETEVKLEQLLSLSYVFSAENALFLTWGDLVSIYEIYDQYKKQRSVESRLKFLESLRPGTFIVLCFGADRLRMTTSYNHDVTIFEEFIDDIYKKGVSLVVNSQQELIRKKNDIAKLINNYGIDLNNFNANSNSGDVLTRKISFKKGARVPLTSVQELLRIGSFDRLLELLDEGQRVLTMLRENKVKREENY